MSKFNLKELLTNHFFSSVSLSLIARAIGIVNIILIIPLIINNYTSEEFAIFSILTQFITIYGFLDLGIGSILINEIIYYRSKKYIKIIRTVVFQLFKFLSVLGIILLALFLLFYFVFGIDFLLNDLSLELLESINNNCIILATLFFIILPTTLIQKIQFGFLDNSIFHICEIVQKGLQIVVIYLSVLWNFDIIELIIYYYLTILLTNFINIILYLFIIKRSIFRSREVVQKQYVGRLIKKSFYYFLGSIFFFFSRTLDTYLIGFYGSFEILKDFEIIKRPFDISLTTLMVVTSVLWPIFTEAHHKKQFKKIRKLLNITILGVFGAMGILILVMIFFGDKVLQFWIGDSTIVFENTTYILAGFVFLIYGIGNILVTYLNSISIFYVQLIIYVILAIIGIPIKIYALTNFGLKGYFISLIVILSIIYVIPMYFVSNKKLNKNFV